MSETATLSAQQTVDALRARFADKVILAKESRGETYVCIQTDAIADVLAFLKSDPLLEYTYFVECMGVDFSAWKHARDLPGRFEVVYNIFSLKLNQRLFLKVSTDDGTPVPTSKLVFGGAEYPEREVQDLFGVVFTGNEAVAGQRFLLPDDWVGHPLRKEYPLGGEDVVFDARTSGPAVEDKSAPHAGESFSGRTGTEEVSGR